MANELASQSYALATKRLADPAPQAMHAIQYVNTLGLCLVDDQGNATPIGGTAFNFAANWNAPVSNVAPNMRFYALDAVNGNDSNLGYSDLSAAAAGLVAVQTPAQLNKILPLNGTGHAVTILINKGTYADLTTFLCGRSGYYYFLCRATCTDATAGSVAFADDTNDRNMNGNVTATGMNSAGYNPTGAPTTRTIQCLKVGGGAPGFPAEAPTISLPGGARLRFDINTSTVALRGIRRTVVGVAGTDTLTMDKLLPAVPTAADIFYLEMPGANFLSIVADGFPVGSQTIGQGQGYISGLNANGTAAGARQISLNGYWGMANCWASGTSNVSTLRSGATSAQTFYTTVNNAGFDTGGMCRFTGSISLYQSNGFTAPGGGSGTYAQGLSANRFGGCIELASTFVTASGLSWNGVTQVAQDSAFTGAGINTDPDCIGTNLVQLSAGYNQARIIGPLSPGAGNAGLLLEGSATIVGLDITNCGTAAAIKMRALNIAMVAGPNLTGSSGNSDVGLDLTDAQNCKIYLQGNPTVTGTLGDIRLANGTIITWTAASAGVIDTNGNTIYGPNNFPNSAGITQLTGDVAAGPGAGSQIATIQANAVTTGKIAANAVTYAKIQTENDQTILGNVSGIVAVPSALTVAQVLTMLGLTTAVSGTLTATRVPFANAAHTLTDSAFLNWTTATNLLTIGGAPSGTTNSGAIKIFAGTNGIAVGGGQHAGIYVTDQDATANAWIASDDGYFGPALIGWQNGSLTPLAVGSATGSILTLTYGASTTSSGTEAARVDGTTGVVTLGTLTPGAGVTVTQNANGADALVGVASRIAASVHGYPYIPTITVVPTGAADVYGTGAAAHAYDTNNHGFWVRNTVGTAWEFVPAANNSATAGAGAASITNLPTGYGTTAKWWAFKGFGGLTCVVPYFTNP